MTYEQFLAAKVPPTEDSGIEVHASEIHPMLKPHQRDIVRWALRKGRAAIFAAFGLGKTFIQLVIAQILVQRTGGRFLIVMPLGVRQEFKRDAAKLGIEVRFVRRLEECGDTGIYLTNYESVRDGKIDPRAFTGVSLDEASILRGFGGTKTFREFMRLFEGSGTYRFVATATPSPNEYIELLAYAGFLGVMDIGQGKTRFFKRDSTKADALTLHPHKEREWWLWISTWAVFLQRPSDLGYSDEGYELPPVEIHWHEVPTDHSDAGCEPSGQGRLVRNAALGVTEAAREKRESLPARMAKLMELRALDPVAHRVIWHDLEAERHALEKAIPDLVTVYGSQDELDQELAVTAFSDGEVAEIAGKPVMLGAGVNFQRHCSWAIYLGIGFKFYEFIQSIHRLVRFLQTKPVRIDLIYTEAEREIRRTLERKWAQHNELVAQMTAIIRQYGLAANAIHSELRRSLGCARAEASGNGWMLVNNDAVLETREMPANSVHLILTSIPFSNQYEYSPSYNDFGHTDSPEHFFEQMDYLTPELLRVLKPGRVAAIHVKDRIVPGGINKLGFQTVYRFSDHCCDHFEKHGFAFLARKTIVTDVVRENNQTYRLGWTEQCKDGSRMGAGLPEYLLLFRKPPTDASDGYADEPVVKDKREYSRSRWQIDAHGFMRSSGNRLLTAEEIRGLPHEKIFKLFRQHSLTSIYDYHEHITLSESLERCTECGHIHTGQKTCGACECSKDGSRLPRTFMLLQPQSWHLDVWADITRMRTLNGVQAAAGREMHLCPLQFDIGERVIVQFSMRGEVVYDPFAGLGTVPLYAMKLGRYGRGCELSPAYWSDSLVHLRAAEAKMSTPTLFNLLGEEDREEEEYLVSSR